MGIMTKYNKKVLPMWNGWSRARSGIPVYDMLKHFGFSFHSTPENLERLLSEHPEVEVVQIQANYYDHNTDGARANGGCREVYDICRKYISPSLSWSR